MESLTAAESARLERAFSVISECAIGAHAFEERVTRLLTGLRSWLGAKAAYLGLVRYEAGVFQLVEGLQSCDFTPAEQELADQYFRDISLHIDPAHAEAVRRILPTRRMTARREDLVDDQTWYSCDHVTRIRRPAGLDGCIYSAVPAEQDHEYLAMSLHRAWGSGAFSPADRDLVAAFHGGARSMLIQWMREREARGELANLPPRLRESLGHLLHGLSEKALAAKMNVSPGTAHEYVKMLHKALGVNSRGELLSWCLKRGVTPESLLLHKVAAKPVRLGAATLNLRGR